MELAKLGTYSTVTEANLIKAKLGIYGIDAVVHASGLSSSLPTFDKVEGVKVLVRDSDLADAYEVLERMLTAGGSQPEEPQPS